MDRSTYQVHYDLLAQVAESEAEERDVRRILGGITEADLDAHEKWKRAPFPIGPANHAHRHSRACSRCESGLSRCVTPEACERAEQEPRTRRGRDEITGLVTVIVGALLAGAIFALALIAAGVQA